MSEVADQIREIIRRDGRYAPRAFEFLSAGLTNVTRSIHGEPPYDEPPHVTGQQLTRELCEMAVARWGRLAPAVLSRWNIRRPRDFGEMVFLLVNEGMMSKRESDRIEDFDGDVWLEEALCAASIQIDLPEGRAAP